MVSRAMVREGVEATLVREAQAGPGNGLSGGFGTQSWPATVIRLPLTVAQRDREAVLGTVSGSVMVKCEQRPQNAWRLNYLGADHYIVDVEVVASGPTDLVYICMVRGPA